MKPLLLLFFAILSPILSHCQKDDSRIIFKDKSEYTSGADNVMFYINLLKDKNIAIVANNASRIADKHLVDTILLHNIDIKVIMTPEHGFRGTADAGEIVGNDIDPRTGIPIISLYGKNKKPSKEQLSNIDLIVFDLQDVGVRFYTYISTLTYVMEAAAESNIPVLVLDRPNPNGFYIDGPILESELRSFVGLHPVPIVYGMTIGEYGLMVNGEGWLNNGIQCKLTIAPMNSYERNAIYELPIKPSPNLPNWESIYLYPTLCLFEGSIVSVGRGTETPFQIYGHPDMNGSHIFTPKAREGASEPKLKNKVCHGVDLTETAHKYDILPTNIHLEWIIDTYNQLHDKNFFTSYFNTLAGTKKLKQQIENKATESEIRASWQDGIDSFKLIRSKYLLYDDF